MQQAPRIIFRIEITPAAKQRLADCAHSNGMTQMSVTSRIVEWFADQSELIQAAILGRYPKSIQGEIAKLILHRMAEAEPELEKVKK